MNNSPSLKNGLRILVIAGALTPFATLGANSMVAAYQDGGLYDELRHIQATTEMSGSMHGAQGPVRSDFVEPSWSTDDSAFYDNLRKIQETPKPLDSMRGAQGPIRSDFATPAWSSDESSFYNNLRVIQPN